MIATDFSRMRHRLKDYRNRVCHLPNPFPAPNANEIQRLRSKNRRSIANNSETSDALSRHVNEAISSFATTELGVIAPLSAPYEAQSALNLRIPAQILKLAEHKIGHILIGSEALKNGLEGTKADPCSAQAAPGRATDSIRARLGAIICCQFSLFQRLQPRPKPLESFKKKIRTWKIVSFRHDESMPLPHTERRKRAP